MIVGLRGRVENLGAAFVQLDVQGVIYGLGISVNTSVAISGALESGADSEIKLFCKQIVREDANLLFGFWDKIELLGFERLIKINGVGPKAALAILSSYTPSEFAKIIESKDVKALQKVPGIGAKGAGKIMVELAGFFAELIDDNYAGGSESGGVGLAGSSLSGLSRAGKNTANEVQQQARDALLSLGFRVQDIQNALKMPEIQNLNDVSSVVKECLKNLGRSS